MAFERVHWREEFGVAPALSSGGSYEVVLRFDHSGRMLACVFALVVRGTPAVAQTDSFLSQIANAARGVQHATQNLSAAVLDLDDPTLRVILSMTNHLEAKAWEVEVFATHFPPGGNMLEIVHLMLREAIREMIQNATVHAGESTFLQPSKAEA